MRLTYVSTKEDIRRFLSFSAHVYRDDPYYRDSMSDIIRMFLHGKTAYLNHADVFPFIIEDNSTIILRAAFIHDYKQKNILMVSFFEAAEKAQAAVDLMLSEGKTLARSKGLGRVVVGLDAHLNYGVGFLASHFDDVPCFGFGYTPRYYLDYFKGLKEHTFISYLTPTKSFDITREQKILDRIKNKGFTFRYADMKQLDREINIYTNLNNACFRDHLWWADRTFQEDRELLYPFRWFIRGENLILAEKAGEPVGFMLWYPDFNQLIPSGKTIGFTTLLKTKLAPFYKIDKIKIAEIGIKPEYQGTGVVLGLFEMLGDWAKDKYTYCEAGWVEENNTKSKGFGIRWEDIGCQEHKKYKAFEVEA